MSGRQRRSFQVGPKTRISGTLVEFDPQDDIELKEEPPRQSERVGGSDNNDDDADGDTPMPPAEPTGSDIARVFKEDIQETEIANLKWFLQFMSEVIIPGSNTSDNPAGDKFVYNPSQQYSPRSAYAALKAITLHVQNRIMSGQGAKNAREKMSPNLSVVLDISSGFKTSADRMMERGVIFDEDTGNVNIDSLLVDPRSEAPNNVKGYPLTMPMEEYGVIQKTGTRIAIVPIAQFRKAKRKDRIGAVSWEEEIIESARNMVDIKEIFDQIISADERITLYEDAVVKEGKKYQEFEPPFFPKLSNMEMEAILKWQRSIQQVRSEMLKDPIYDFATMVAGLLNRGVNGVEQLLSNRGQTTFLAPLTSIPSASEKASVMKSERDRLYRLKYEIESAVEEQRKNDVRREQRRLNGLPDYQFGDEDEFQIEKEWAESITRFTAANQPNTAEVPKRGGFVASRENVPLSKESRRLMQSKEFIDDMIKGVVAENSRSRMFHALEWLEKVEILKRAEITPIFKAGLENALSSLSAAQCAFANIDSFRPFVESPSRKVRNFFAQLVALEIADIDNIYPKKNYLDKRYMQVNLRKTRLIEAINEFVLVNNVVYDPEASGMPAKPFNAAYYAFARS